VIEEEFVKKGKKCKRNLMDLATIRDLIEEHNPDRCVLEKVAARSGQGVTSMFRFGQGFGEWQGLLTGLRVQFITPTPQSWKKTFGLSSDKNASLEMARELFPEKAKECFRLKKQDGVAEAALIAKFGFDHPELFE
jgi:crossover junction endodeoxyribonuclease RuvC